ncbi:hypothetical protein QYE76_006541 [Lolium multiflorum]|uniref:At1g61320/AtMIF1 LRR domain-containing protein n=1 Tax=Lolium multiflorum TaxID=4521 RepID=A0AAD8RUX3_LOLMU|nr:hypothetical protein QYE76_006541 [Lolium multiflorum]
MGQKASRGRTEAHGGSIVPCQHDGDSQGSNTAVVSVIKQLMEKGHSLLGIIGCNTAGGSLPYLPEEIWHHIRSLMPMRDAARAACVSRAFLHSWRCHPNLNFDMRTMCSNKILLRRARAYNDNKRDRTEYNNNIGKVLSNHRRAGVKTLKLHFHGPFNTKSYNRLSSWLQIAITPVLEELALNLVLENSKYDFPCSLLSDGSGNTIRHLHLGNCVLRPTVNLSLRCLTELHLRSVRVTGDELWRLLSNSFALEILILKECQDIICLQIPCHMQRLSYLEVSECCRLELIENKAPNISSFDFKGGEIQLSLGEALQVKKLKLNHWCAISYAIDELASSVPNLETLTLWSSREEIVNAPMVPSKFLHLKVLSISVQSWIHMWEYDFLSLVSFLDASPSLETFDLSVPVPSRYDWIIGDPSTLRKMPERHHDKLKTVRITGFCCQKSLVELTRHILESARSLKRLTLTTIDEDYLLYGGHNRFRKCPALDKEFIREARKSNMAVKTYIEGKVPSTVQLEVFKPCSQCHAL